MKFFKKENKNNAMKYKLFNLTILKVSKHPYKKEYRVFDIPIYKKEVQTQKLRYRFCGISVLKKVIKGDREKVYLLGVQIKTKKTVYGTFFTPQGEIKNNISVSAFLNIPAEITFNVSEQPLVSIIIPVYEQDDYTKMCLNSIFELDDDVSYEVIVANDNPDSSLEAIREFAKNITIINNKENLRFLLNCNNAAKDAKGKYILFLNNDTQVQNGWLSSLVELIERDETIGMVGSKLVYPDGRLQEAGGILWKDGSAWNYGNGQNPNFSEFNYVKEVDYISGASIMLSKKLWDEIGGFDTQFVPAYCEDSDLAFEIRKRGYKVMYQPKSVVVHYEGISHGTDTSSGQKSYQVVNCKKFYEKWKDALAEHFSSGENVFLAKDRSRNKKTVLVIDHYIPQFDKDAGSRTIDHYLDMFISLGYNVKFLGDNFYYDPDYAPRLEQKGIELLCGEYYFKNWKEWLQQNGMSIDIVFTNRPHISVKYVSKVRESSNAKIIYYGHDLHYLRMMREAEITGDENKEEIAKMRELEYSVINQVDCVYYPSSIEIEEVVASAPKVCARAIPAYLYNASTPINFDFANRCGLMFVGGFRHIPNVDAIQWFAEKIVPLLLQEIPEIEIYILGSHAPEEIKNLASENIRIVGFVSDEELQNYYKKCRLSIVPLRYGAGIKGKVIEAMYNGLPVITTPTGAEGINAENVLTICDDEKSFAQSIVKMYNSETDLIAKSKLGIDFVNKYFTFDNAQSVILQDFENLSLPVNENENDDSDWTVCPICDATAKLFSVKESKNNSYKYFECLSCESIFIDNDCIKNIDSGKGVIEYDQGYWELENISANDRCNGSSIARVAEAMCYARIPVKKFLDIGSGTGLLLDLLAKYLPCNSDIFYAYEKFPPETARTKSKNYFSDFDLLREALQGEKFDCGICIEVVEHLTPKMLKNLFREVANMSNEGALYLINSGFVNYTKFENENYLDPFTCGHIVSYSASSLRLLLSDLGFTVTEVPGKTWLIAVEYKAQPTSEELSSRIWKILPENKAILNDAEMGSVMQILGLESCRAYLN